MQATGAYLRAFREARRLERLDIASAVGVTPNTVGEWELGKSRPNIIDFDLWCRFLRVPFDQVMAMVRNKTATPLEGMQQAVKYLVKYEGLDEETARSLKYWRQFYGDARVREVLGPDLD